MDDQRFDDLIRTLGAKRVSRASALRGLAGGALAAVAATALDAGDSAAKAKKRGKGRKGGVRAQRAPQADAGKVAICHFTKSENNPYTIINVSRNSVQEQSHLSHGDFEFTDCCLDSECELPDDVDPQCNVAFCDAGTCDTRFKAGDCNDGDLCTEDDQCVDQNGTGVCEGTPIDCGDACLSCNEESGSCEDNGECPPPETCTADNQCSESELCCLISGAKFENQCARKRNCCESDDDCPGSTVCCLLEGSNHTNQCVDDSACTNS